MCTSLLSMHNYANPLLCPCVHLSFVHVYILLTLSFTYISARIYAVTNPLFSFVFSPAIKQHCLDLVLRNRLDQWEERFHPDGDKQQVPFQCHPHPSRATTSSPGETLEYQNSATGYVAVCLLTCVNLCVHIVYVCVCGFCTISCC